MFKPKPPSPYHVDVEALRFGTWETKKGDHSIAAGYLPFALLNNSFMNTLHSNLEAKILFSAQGKILYEFPYRTAAAPGSNKAKVEIPFSSVTAVQAEGEMLLLQLSSPPTTYVGTQKMDKRLSKERASYDKNPLDFSGGPVRNFKVHSIRFSSANAAQRFRNKLLGDHRRVHLGTSALQAGSMDTFPAQQAAPAGRQAVKRAAPAPVPTPATLNIAAAAAATAAAPPPAAVTAYAALTAGAAAAAATAAAGGPAAKRSKAAAPKKAAPKKRKATLAPGWLSSLPSSPGPWLSRCCSRWGLSAPYDPSCSEAHWQDYYRERASLEWLTKAYQGKWLRGVRDPLAEECDTQGTQTDQTSSKPNPAADKPRKLSAKAEELRWQEDFAPPDFSAICREYYGDSGSRQCEELADMVAGIRGQVARRLAGCKGVEDAAALGQRLAAGCFVTSYWANWEDCDEPRTVEISARMYSAAATTRCIEFKLDWHLRPRLSYTECFNSAYASIRDPDGASASKPQASSVPGKGGLLLYSMSLQDSGYQKRSFLTAKTCKQLGEVMTGYKGLLGDRKVAGLAVAAAGTGQLHAENDYVQRCLRRKLKLADGEDSEERSADDCDSDNEELKRSKKARYEDTGGLGGFGGFGGFGALFGVGGGYSDDDEEGYSSDGGYIYGYD